jgi:hypothetical protein
MASTSVIKESAVVEASGEDKEIFRDYRHSMERATSHDETSHRIKTIQYRKEICCFFLHSTLVISVASHGFMPYLKRATMHIQIIHSEDAKVRNKKRLQFKNLNFYFTVFSRKNNLKPNRRHFPRPFLSVLPQLQ